MQCKANVTNAYYNIHWLISVWFSLFVFCFLLTFNFPHLNIFKGKHRRQKKMDFLVIHERNYVTFN